MSRKIDLTGKIFGLLKVVSEDPRRSDYGRLMWVCSCSCGLEKSIDGQSLRSGLSKSCGCARDARNRISSLSHGMARKGQRSPEYTTWCRMIERCENDNIPNFDDYGGRGIKICARWRNSFPAFLSDMGPKPSMLHSIERDDTNGNYTPKNCRWATKDEQAANTRKSRIWIIDGERFNTGMEAAIRHGVTQPTIVRWCNGFYQDGVQYPPRHGCSSFLKYGKRNNVRTSYEGRDS